MGDLVPVICFHSWLPVTADGIEECRHCKLAYHVEERFAGLKGAKKSGIKRDKFRNGDPKKANTVRPPFCNGDGPEPIAYVARSVAIEWGILIEPPPTPPVAPIEPEKEKALVVTKQTENQPITPPNDTLSVKNDTPHPTATGMNYHKKHAFIEKHREAILKDCETLDILDVAKLWGFGRSTLEKLRIGEHRVYKRKPKKTPRETVGIIQPKDIDKEYEPTFLKTIHLKDGAGDIKLEVTGNVLAFQPKDRDFVMQLVKMIEDHETNTGKI